MKKYFAGTVSRLLLPALLTSAALGTMSCSKDAPPIVAPQPDNSAADDATIQKYLTDNNITNARKQASGLYYIPVITNPNGLPATAGRRVSVNYTGSLLDGTVFDATSRHNPVAPITFTLGAGQVIQGWDEGIALMKKSEKSILLIPSGMAYGANPPTSAIPANAVLRFDVELTTIQ